MKEEGAAPPGHLRHSVGKVGLSLYNFTRHAFNSFRRQCHPIHVSWLLLADDIRYHFRVPGAAKFRVRVSDEVRCVGTFPNFHRRRWEVFELHSVLRIICCIATSYVQTSKVGIVTPKPRVGFQLSCAILGLSRPSYLYL